MSARNEGAKRPRAEKVEGAGRAAACADTGGPYAAEGFQAKRAQRATEGRVRRRRAADNISPVKQQWWPTLQGPWTAFGVSVFCLGLALLGLLTPFGNATSVGGFPIRLLSVLMLVFVAYMWALVIKSLALRRKSQKSQDDE